MDSFEFDHRLAAPESSFDATTWVVTSTVESSKTTFANDMDAFLEGLELGSDEEDAPGTEEIEFSTDARANLLSTLKENENLEMGGGCDISRRSNASATTGASTHRSATSGKLAIEKAHVSQLREKLDAEAAEKLQAEQQAAEARKREEEATAKLAAAAAEREKKREEEKRKFEAMMARMQAMEAALARSHQVPPHHSGGAAAGEAPPDQYADRGGSAAAQG